jgi:hypothetical protein
LDLGLTDAGLFIKGEALKRPILGDPGPFEPIEKALVLAVGLLLKEETIQDLRHRGGLLFCPLDLLIESAGDALET